MENAIKTLSMQKTNEKPTEIKNKVLKQMKIIIQQVKKLEKQASKCKEMKFSTHANNQK